MLSHAQVVHFPVALFLTAVLVELMSLFWQKSFFSKVSLLLLILGSVTAFWALITGDTAAEAVRHIDGIEPLLSTHQNAGKLAAWYFLFLTVFKTGLMKLGKDLLPWRLIVSMGLIFGAVLIYRTGLFGGKLVYERGAGVKPVMEKYLNNNENF
ncbi:MAG: DUF2231 domain-containing protein [Calditrichaceae bacterium]